METSDWANPVARLRKLTEGKRVAMLTTIDDEGFLRSRPMWAQRIEEDGSLWFLTSTSSHMVHEVERDSHVNLSFSDSESDRYVSVSGIAKVAHDPEQTRRLWELVDPNWFPKDTEGPDLRLLRVDISKVEYWDSKAGAMHRLNGFAPTDEEQAPPP